MTKYYVISKIDYQTIRGEVFALNSKLAETEMAKKFAPEYNFVARHIPTPEAREFVSYVLKNKAKNKTIFALASEFYDEKNMNCYFDAFVAEVTVLLDRLKIKVVKA